MYSIKIDSLKAKDSSKKDYSYLVDIFKRMQADVTEEEIILPDSVLNKIENLELTDDIYDYFSLVWSNENKEVDLDDIIGSHDFRNINHGNWLQNMMIDCEEKRLEKYLSNPQGILEDERNPILLFEHEGKYYVADGHHRLSTLLTHYQILKSKNLPLDSIPTKIPAIVRVIPKNMDFVKTFVSFCAKYKLYEEDEAGMIPYFTQISSNDGYPIIKYEGIDFEIDENTNLEEFLLKIQEDKKRGSI